MIEAAIFDLDGTLLDTLGDLAFAVNTVLAERGFPQHPTDAYRFFVGNGMETMLKRAAPEGMSSESLSSMVARVKDVYGKSWARTTRPYEGITAVLDSLCKRMPLAVLSNKPHDFTLEMIEYFFPQQYFSVVQGSLPGKVAKPDPQFALDIATTWGISPPRIMFLGDSQVDMKTAVSAGMFPVGVLWGFRDKEELVAHGARIVLRCPGEICAAVSLREEPICPLSF